MKSKKKIQVQLGEMEEYISRKSEKNPDISKASVSWHLAHNLKVIHSILDGLEGSDPSQYQKKFSWMKELVYFTGKIPRGKARAPKNVVPEEINTETDLKEQISRARNRISGIEELPKNAYFEHPYFGHIKKDDTPKFLVIHTEHHLKIIRDILKGN